MLKKKEAGLEFDALLLPFLKDATKKLSIEQFLGSPLTIFKECGDKLADLFIKRFKITTIVDLAEWAEKQSYDEIQKMLYDIPLASITTEKWLILSTMAMNIKNMKRSESISPKFLFVGLNKAGKTSLIQSFVYKQGTDDSLDTVPTLGVETNKISYPDGSLLIWELGGQEKFRNLYFQNPEKFFLGVQALVYIIDLQDQMRFNECCLYLIQILETLKNLNTNCIIILLYHKADPNFSNSSQFIDNFERIEGLLIPEIKKRDFKFVRRFTSVYYSYDELYRLLEGMIDINLMSKLLNIANSDASESTQSNFKTKIKEFFGKFGKSKESEIDVSDFIPNLDDKKINQIELENIIQIIGSQGFKEIIYKKNYSRASIYIEKLNSLWKLKD